MTKLVLLVSLLGFNLLAQPAPATGVLRGRAGTKGLDALQGVRVTVSRMPDEKAPRNSPPFVPWIRVVNTDANGFFQLSGIPEGNYRICAEVVDGIYLNPCRWEKPIEVEIATKKNNEVVTQSILLDEGVLLLVTIEDPAGRLVETFNKGRSSSIFVGVDGLPAKLELAGPKQLVYRMTVPKNKVRKVDVSSPGFRFRDGGVEGRKLSKEVAVTGPGRVREVVFTVAVAPAL